MNPCKFNNWFVKWSISARHLYFSLDRNKSGIVQLARREFTVQGHSKYSMIDKYWIGGGEG